ncbi:MAG: YbjN domain-containing protein [Lachnospiraceae bacterium]|nr:YbjN domain-containing protein [Lachnospiraceae bacterium]
MAETAKGEELYNQVCNVLKKKNWDPECNPDDLVVSVSIDGEDLPISMNIRIKERLEAISIFCLLPFDMTEEHRMDVAAAINFVNSTLDEGSFDFNIQTGDVGFRVTALYGAQCIIGDELIDHLTEVAVSNLNRFTALFFALSKGMISLEKFLEAMG